MLEKKTVSPFGFEHARSGSLLFFSRIFISKGQNFSKQICESYQSGLFHSILRGLQSIVHLIEVDKTRKEKRKKNYRKNESHDDHALSLNFFLKD